MLRANTRLRKKWIICILPSNSRLTGPSPGLDLVANKLSAIPINDKLSLAPIKIPKPSKPKLTLDDKIRMRVGHTDSTRRQKKLVKMNTINSFWLKNMLENTDSKADLNSLKSTKLKSTNTPANGYSNMSILTPQAKYLSEQHSLCMNNKLNPKRPSSELQVYKRRRKPSKNSKLSKVMKAKKTLNSLKDKLQNIFEEHYFSSTQSTCEKKPKLNTDIFFTTSGRSKSRNPEVAKTSTGPNSGFGEYCENVQSLLPPLKTINENDSDPKLSKLQILPKRNVESVLAKHLSINHNLSEV